MKKEGTNKYLILDNKKFYDSTKVKVIDFCIGFFGPYAIIALIILLSVIVNLLGTLMIPFIILAIVMTVLAFKRERRFLGIGLLAGFVIPLLVFGVCSGVLFVGLLFSH